jgi:hypothetical protein
VGLKRWWSKNMYLVKYSEQYNESYVADEHSTEEFSTIDEASNGFKNITIDLLNDPLTSEKIATYLEDYHSDEDTESYSAGMVIELYRNKDRLAFIFFEYDSSLKKLKTGSYLEVEVDNLDESEEFEIKKLENFYV